MSAERTRYRFGPLERRGLIAGWRGGQIGSVAAGLVVAVLALHARPNPASVVIALVAVVGAVAFACWPVAGRTGEEWLPTVTHWTSTGLSGGHRTRSPAPGAGHRIDAGGRPGAGAAGDGPHAGGPHAGGPVQPRRRRPGGGAGGPHAPRRLHDAGGLRPVRTGPTVGLEILQTLGERGRPAGGVVLDHRTRTYTAALAVRGHSFALLGPEEKERRVGGWAAVLASLARERSVVHRLQWTASALPDDGEAVRRFLAERAVLGPDVAAHRSYADLLAGASTCRHEVLLAVQVRALGTSARAVRAAGGGHAGACAVLWREVSTLERLLGDADVVVERVLDAPTLAAVIRRAGDPGPVPAAGAGVVPGAAAGRVPGAAGGHLPVDGDAGAGPGAPGVPGVPGVLGGGDPEWPGPGAWPWPMATEEEWGCLRTDGTWHATYWVAEWPRVDVGPDFLGPLLLGPVRRSVAVVMEALSPNRAVRQVEQARTADLADSELRRRGGFLATARRTREAELVSRREEELADGHASFRFSGYVTVTAPSRELLDAACEMTEQAAGQCRLELRRLWGDQGRAFTCTLPLCRGLS